jgi:hypothetical protein
VDLDHVILGVRDLEDAARRLETQHRLTAVEGGTHEAAGTHNWVVPLGESYLELLAVQDEALARESPFGTWVLDGATDEGAWIGWCLRTDDIVAVAHRLGLEPHGMARAGLTWRIAGFERTRRDPAFPFFIEWDVPLENLPGRAGGPTSASDARLTAIEVGGDEHALRDWVGELPGTVRVVDGPPGVQSVTVAGAGGVEVIRG